MEKKAMRRCDNMLAGVLNNHDWSCAEIYQLSALKTGLEKDPSWWFVNLCPICLCKDFSKPKLPIKLEVDYLYRLPCRMSRATSLMESDGLIRIDADKYRYARERERERDRNYCIHCRHLSHLQLYGFHQLEGFSQPFTLKRRIEAQKRSDIGAPAPWQEEAMELAQLRTQLLQVKMESFGSDLGRI